MLIHLAAAGYTPPSAIQAGGTAAPVTGPMLAPLYAAQGVKSEDNWDIAEFQAFALGSGTDVPVASSGFHRFTGNNPSLDIKRATGDRVPVEKSRNTDFI